MKKILVLANEFPYGYHEQYMETEEKYYSRFDKVWIAALQLSKKTPSSKRSLHSRADIIPVWCRSRYFYYINCLTVLADRNLFKEIFELIRTHKFTKGRVIHLFTYLSRAHYDAREIDKALKKENKDGCVIYSYRFEYQPYIALLLKKKWGNRQIIVSRAHGYDLHEERNLINYIPMRNIILNEVDYVFPCSKHGVKYIKDRYKIGKACVDVRYLGTVDHGEKEFVSHGKTLSIVSCSNVVDVKRIDKIVDALSLIEDIPIEWIHYGDGGLLNMLKVYAMNKLHKNVKASFPGNVDNTQLLNIYSNKDFCFLLNVSSSEGLPVSIMEAMSFGIPCIATDVGGTGEIVKNEHGILLSKDAAPKEIADAVRAIYSMDEEDYITLRHNSRKFWKDHFDAENNYRKFIEEIYSLNL